MTGPVLSVIQGRNARLFAEVARLWIKPDNDVLDLTYGRGKFWSEYEPAHLATNDLYTAAEYAFDYCDLPEEWAEMWDVVVFDPPYISTGGTTKLDGDFHDAYGLTAGGGWQAVRRDITSGMANAKRVTAPGGIVMVKCCDYVESGQRRWMSHYVREFGRVIEFEQVDEFVHFSGTGPQPLTNRDGTPRRQIHSRRAHSFLCVFRKAK